MPFSSSTGTMTPIRLRRPALLLKPMLKKSLGLLFESYLSLRPQGLRMILAYHHVFPSRPTTIHDPAMYVTSATLEMHLRELNRFFEIVPADVFFGEGTAMGRNVCAITFDDGFDDVYRYAYPILKEYHAPATVFLTISAVEGDRRFWFDDLFDLANLAVSDSRSDRFIEYWTGAFPTWHPEELCADSIGELTRRLKGLEGDVQDAEVARAFAHLAYQRPAENPAVDWKRIEEMGNWGFTFGSHGLNHVLHTRLGAVERRLSLRGSLGLLCAKGIPVTRVFSYPNGDWDANLVSLIRETGYAGAVTMAPGLAGKQNLYAMPRIGLHENISSTPDLFWFRILQGAVGR